jgi:hypothetical protein
MAQDIKAKKKRQAWQEILNLIKMNTEQYQQEQKQAEHSKTKPAYTQTYLKNIIRLLDTIIQNNEQAALTDQNLISELQKILVAPGIKDGLQNLLNELAQKNITQALPIIYLLEGEKNG